MVTSPSFSLEISVDSRVSSGTTSIAAEKQIASANTPLPNIILPNFKISISDPNVTGIVIRPFIVEITLTETEEEYIATSHMSNTFELAATPAQALKSYLKALVDELAWLQKNEKSLSPSILEELDHLQCYIRIV